MKHCGACRVDVANEAQHCPLCGEQLDEQVVAPNSEAPPTCKNTYPVIAESFYRYNFWLRFMMFVSYTAAIVCLFVDYFTDPHGLGWSIIVLVGIVYVWVTVTGSLRSMRNFAFRYGVQIVSISVVLYITDFYSGNTHWSINYAIPFFLILATFAITLLILLKQVARSEYLLSQLVIGLFGLVPLILLPFGILDVVWPTVASGAYALITLGGTVLFADRYVEHELKKRFHI
ncbi:MAG: DUF6320 domain-containing protein [Acetanaerobacterium sp.]